MKESLQKIAETLSQTDWIDTITSIGTAIAAIAAAVSACIAKKAARASQESNELQKEQIELQNKQQLFEMRLSNYVACKKFIDSYSKIDNLVIKDESGNFICDSIKSYFIVIGGFYKFFKDMTKADKIQSITESMDVMAEKTELLFHDKKIHEMANFVRNYAKILGMMYMCINLKSDSSKEIHKDLKNALDDNDKLFKKIENDKVLLLMKQETSVLER